VEVGPHVGRWLHFTTASARHEFWNVGGELGALLGRGWGLVRGDCGVGRQAASRGEAGVGLNRACGILISMTPMTKKLLEQVESWPQEDQEELAEYAREIEARRSGVYRATPEELRAIDGAERSGVAAVEEVEAAFRSFRRT
jgi:hypothetical protein